ncbi:HNH endonuclease signature motif containing protein [Bradyrhizobium elkanii]
MEDCLVTRKHLITQALQIARSKTRFERAADLYRFLVDQCSQGNAPTDEDVVGVIIPSAQSKVLAISQSSSSTQFTTETKSQIYLRDSLKTALKCSICQGLIEPAKSVSYDHINRVRDGGTGDASNGQITHPYCNTGYKN